MRDERPTIGDLLKQLNDRMKQFVDGELQPFALTMTQAKFLHFLRGRMGEATSQRDFEEHFDIAHPTVVGVLRRMQRKGLIRAETDPRDGRRKLITLGPAEERIHRQITAARERIDCLLIAGLDPEQIESLEVSLLRLLDNLREAEAGGAATRSGLPLPA